MRYSSRVMVLILVLALFASMIQGVIGHLCVRNNGIVVITGMETPESNMPMNSGKKFEEPNKTNHDPILTSTVPSLTRTMRTLPGEAPMTFGCSGRGGRDIWLKDVDITANPMSQIGMGLVGKTTSFSATFQNNGSAGDVEIRMKTTRQPLLESEEHWNLPVEYWEKKIVSSPGGGAEGTASFDWTPTVSNTFIVNFTAYEPGDPSPGNNNYYLDSPVGLYGDEANATIGIFKNPTGNFHISSVYDDRAPAQHSIPNAWGHSSDTTHTCPSGNNTLDIPTINQNHFDRRYPIYLFFLFNGILADGDHLKLLTRVDGGQWELKAEISAAEAGAGGLNDGWFHWVSDYQGEFAPALIMNTESGTNLDYRIVTGEAGGAAKGFYFDDLFIWGVQNYTSIDPPKPPFTAVSVEKANNEEAIDTNGNDVIDKTGKPSENLSFDFTLENVGTAVIDLVMFDIEELPKGWGPASVEFIPSSITSPFSHGETRDFRLTVTIPDDAGASHDFVGGNESYPYFIEFSATARGMNYPEPPEPPEDTDRYKVEIINTGHPIIEVTCGKANRTGTQGELLVYSLIVENSGYCNITGKLDLETERISFRDTPVAKWNITTDIQYVEIVCGESVTIPVNITIPEHTYAGYYRIDLILSIDGLEKSYIISLIVGVIQVFGLELDFKDRDPSPIEVDPVQMNHRYHVITFEIKNLGNGWDTAKFEVEPVFGIDEDWLNLEENDIRVDPSGMLFDENYISIEFTIPEDAEYGNHIFKVRAVSMGDPSCKTRSNEEIVTFYIQRPDLVFSMDLEPDPELPEIGEKTHFSVILLNNGTTGATAFSVDFYVNDYLEASYPIKQLEKNEFIDLYDDLTYTFFERGEHIVRIVVDPPSNMSMEGNVTEIDEGNNEIEMTVMVTGPDVGFGIGGMRTYKGPESIDADPETGVTYLDTGDEYTISIFVRNYGDADAKGVTVNLKVMYTDPNGWPKREFDGNCSIGTIKAGNSAIAAFTWIPEQFGTKYYYIFTIDSQGTFIGEPPSHSSERIFLTEPEPGPKEDDKEVSVHDTALLIVGTVVLGAILVIVITNVIRKRRSKP